MARTKAFNADHVIDQAMELFRQHGYEATSIRDLVAYLGVSSSSLYSTFGDKDALFMLALERHSRVESATLRQRLHDSTNPRATIEQLFDYAIDQLLSDKLPYASLTLRAVVELGVSKPAIAAFLAGYFDEIVQIFAAFLREAAGRGQLALFDPAEDVARHLILALFNLSFLAQMEPDRARLEGYARVVLRVLDGSARANAPVSQRLPV